MGAIPKKKEKGSHRESKFVETVPKVAKKKRPKKKGRSRKGK